MQVSVETEMYKQLEAKEILKSSVVIFSPCSYTLFIISFSIVIVDAKISKIMTSIIIINNLFSL